MLTAKQGVTKQRASESNLRGSLCYMPCTRATIPPARLPTPSQPVFLIIVIGSSFLSSWTLAKMFLRSCLPVRLQLDLRSLSSNPFANLIFVPVFWFVCKMVRWMCGGGMENLFLLFALAMDFLFKREQANSEWTIMSELFLDLFLFDAFW